MKGIAVEPEWAVADAAEVEPPETSLPATEKAGIVGVAVRQALDSLRLLLAEAMGRVAEDVGGPETAPAESSRLAAARAVDRAAYYLHETTVEQMGDDLTDWVRHHPRQSIAAALALGLTVGALLKRR